MPYEFVTSCSRWAATSKSSRMRRSSRSRPASAGACTNVRFFFPLLDARLRSMSLSASARRCSCTAAYSSSSSASPASRHNDDPNAGLGDRGGGDVVRLLVDELVDPELECPLPTALVTLIRPLCRSDIRFLFDFSNDSSISIWIVATIGACRSCGGGDDWCTSRVSDGIQTWLLAAWTGVGLWQQSSSSVSDTDTPSSNISGKRGGRASRLACGEAFGFSTGRRALGGGSFRD